MKKRTFLTAAALSAAALAATPALAQDNTFKIGLILPMTGQQATTGRQVEAAARLYMAQNGDTVAGKKIQLKFRIPKLTGQHLLESPLSKDQKVATEGDWLRISATVIETEQLIWWLRGFGKEIEGVRPLALARKL